jgi:hypothetical protein
MRHVIPFPRRSLVVAGCILACTALIAAAGKTSKPSITLTALPPVGFAPARIVFTAELKGDDSEELYCPAVEWDWGDDTRSETKVDCEPFQPGKNEIKRRFVMERTFELDGEWKVEIRLKQKNKVVAKGGTVVRIRPGIGGDGRPD